MSDAIGRADEKSSVTTPPTPVGLLFDLDGLLIDSESVSRRSYFKACEEVGLAASDEIFLRCVGTTGDRTKAILSRAYGSGFDADAFEVIWDRFYDEEGYGRPVPKKDGAVELLTAAAHLAIPCAVVTSSWRDGTAIKLRLAELDSHFQARVCGDDITNGKPHPDPYLAAAAAIGVSAELCWALEDSEIGVRSASSSGAFTIQVPDLVPPPLTPSPARLIVDSLHDVRRLLHESLRSPSGAVVE